jgi:predicted nuclease of restriction endonuclease-like (RecB) superfamily
MKKVPKKVAALLQQSPGSIAPSEDVNVPALVRDLGAMIDEARKHVAATADATLVRLYWQLGHRIRTDVLEERRADYGSKIVADVGKQLAARYGRGFGLTNIYRMVTFSSVFEDPKIVAALLRQLGWTHFTILMPIKDALKREFYAEMCRVERWSTRELRERIDSMLYERTALSKKPEALIRQELSALRDKDELNPTLVFRDPYVLDFLELADTYSEKDLESAILREIERFLLELGTGFAFVERQKRITLDGDDHYLDLLFFHRRLQRLVAIELKLGDFKAADAGQVELYLRWLDKYERQPSEQAPLGIILCAGKKRETVEVLDLDARGIHVAEYLTDLPPRAVLEDRLHRAIKAARERLALGVDAAVAITPTAKAKAPRSPRNKSPDKRRRRAGR